MPGLVAKSVSSCGVKTCCSRPATGETHVGSRMKVVTLETWGWIVGRTWMPEELGVVSRIVRWRAGRFDQLTRCR